MSDEDFDVADRDYPCPVCRHAMEGYHINFVDDECSGCGHVGCDCTMAPGLLMQKLKADSAGGLPLPGRMAKADALDNVMRALSEQGAENGVQIRMYWFPNSLRTHAAAREAKDMESKDEMYEYLHNLPDEMVFPQVDADLRQISGEIYWASGSDEEYGFAIALQHIRNGNVSWLQELASMKQPPKPPCEHEWRTGWSFFAERNVWHCTKCNQEKLSIA